MSTTEEIKARLDVTEVISGYLRLQKAGRNFRALCPFHNEKSPSFMVSPERQIWHCFGCGESGDIFSFVMKIEGVEFKEALTQLAERAGVKLEKFDVKAQSNRQKIYQVCEQAARFFENNLENKAGAKALDYLLDRGLSKKTIKEFRLGYSKDSWDDLFKNLKNQGFSDKDLFDAGMLVKRDFSTTDNQSAPLEVRNYYDRFRNRIMFPIADIGGRIIGFSARIMPGGDDRMGKYINTPETLVYNKSRVIYGLDKAKLPIRKSDFCIFVEGQLDVIMSYQAGVKNAVATSGTALTTQHLVIIKRYTKNLALCFDSDEAGGNATKRAIDLTIAEGFVTKVIILGQDKDPADIIKKDSKLWKEAITQKKPTISFYFENVFSRHDVNNIEGKKKIVEELLPVIKLIPNHIERAHYLNELAQKAKVDEKSLETLFKELSNKSPERPHYGRQPEESKKKVSSREQLEELVLGILALYPKNIGGIMGNIKDEWFSLPASQKIYSNLKNLSKKKGLDSKRIIEYCDESLRKDIDLIIFKTEQNVSNIGLNPAEALKNYTEELKKLYKKEKLDYLVLEIKQAEANNDIESVKKLSKEFNEISKEV